MNLLDPDFLKPEVLRRAFALYCDGLHPANAPHVWEEDDHDIGLDGRFNLSLLGRYIEETYRLDQITKLKPTASAGEIEAVFASFRAAPRTCLEADRFVAAMKHALALAPHEVNLILQIVSQHLCAEAVVDAARRISNARRRSGASIAGIAG